MNLPHATISIFLRRTSIAAAAAGVLLMASCTVLPPPQPYPGLPFPPDGRPRYGHNGTDSPNRADRRDRNQGQPYIKRDPNNDRVDITPPTPRPNSGFNDAAPGVNPDPASSPASDPTPAPQPLAPREDLPFGIPVVGKKGMVYSPYAPEKGVVDVENLKRGTRVRCPYTEKHFRVP